MKHSFLITFTDFLKSLLSVHQAKLKSLMGRLAYDPRGCQVPDITKVHLR